MKYWEEGCSSVSLIGLDNDGWDDYLGTNVLKVIKNKDGTINFEEECDNFYSYKYTKQEALELLDELTEFIKAG